MHGEDDEVTVEVNGEQAGVDPDATRTMRFPPPKLSKGVDRPPPEPPQWWEPDADDDRGTGRPAASEPPARPGGKGRPTVGRPTVGPPPGPIQPPAGMNAFQTPPNSLGRPAWESAAPDVPVFPPPRNGALPPSGGSGVPVFPPPSSGGPEAPVFPPPGAPVFPSPAGGGPESPAFPPPHHAEQSASRPPGHTGPRSYDASPPPVGAEAAAQAAGTTADSLRPDRLLRTRRRPPAGGWRKAVFTLTGGLIRPGDSKTERRRQELIERIRQPVTQGHFRVAVMSLKGGVGKTTTTIGLGSTLAHQRGDRVIAVDANPDRGTLSEKLRMESPATVRHLLNDRAGLWRYADVRSYTSQAPSRLEVLASDRDPAISEAFNADDYRAVAQILEQFYSIAITDCGTGMLHSAMGAILDMADQIVLVSPVTVDGARSASATLDWLQAHGHQDLAVSAVVVLSAVKNQRRNAVNVAELEEHFTKRCRAVIGVPFDPHLEQGSEVDLDLMRTSTRDMYLEVGATIADRFNPGALS